jgi:hypothetical protein
LGTDPQCGGSEVKKWSWRISLVGAWATVLALGTSWRLSHEWRRPAPPNGEIICGPIADLAEEGPRLKARSRIAHDLLVGRTSLLAAAAAFRRLDDHPSSWARRPIGYEGAASEDEGYCRVVITWASFEAPPGRADERMGRIRAELDARLKDGTLRLPDAEDANPAGKGRETPTGKGS